MAFFGSHVQVQNFKFEEDFNTIRNNVKSYGSLYFDDKNEKYFLGIDRQWSRPTVYLTNPTFVDGTPSKFDALQGELGNCWLVSAIESITMNEQLMKFVVPRDQSYDKSNYVGAFHFRLWKLGNWYDVVVDDFLPFNTKAGKPLYIHSRSGNVLWAALLEKAYVKFYGVNGLSPTYRTLHAGAPTTGLQDMSGGLIEHITIYAPPPKNFKTNINAMFWKKAAIFMSTTIDGTSVNILMSHTYLITNVFMREEDDPDYPDLCLVRLLNPRGDMEWKGQWNEDDFNMWKQIDINIRNSLGLVSREDGEFWMSVQDLAGWFTRQSVCYVSPREYAEIHTGTISFLRDFQTVAVNGEWVENVSAYGSQLDERFKNPQYAFKFESPPFQPNDKFYVVIELTHRSKEERQLYTDVAFYIYPIKNSSPVPLNLEYMIDYEPLKKPDFDKSRGRAYLDAFELEPGDYCIIPCTKNKHEKSQFLLRIFSGGLIQRLTADQVISKTLPMAEESMIEPLGEINKLFNYVVEGQINLNWEGLREILNIMMNSNGSYFMIRSSLIQSIRNFIGKYLPIWSSNDNEIGGIRFTKDECRSMIAMFDNDYSGKLSFPEFTHLWKKISFWTKVYKQFQNDESYLNIAQLRDALSTTGYEVNKKSLHSLSYLYANDQGNIVLADFILCAVNLETAITLWQKIGEKDVTNTRFTLEKWVKSTLNL